MSMVVALSAWCFVATTQPVTWSGALCVAETDVWNAPNEWFAVVTATTTTPAPDSAFSSKILPGLPALILGPGNKDLDISVFAEFFHLLLQDHLQTLHL